MTSFFSRVRVLGISITPTLITTGIAIFAPEDALAKVPILQTIVNFWLPLIPAFKGQIAASSLPQVTALVIAIGWTLLPFQLITWMAMLLFPFNGQVFAQMYRARSMCSRGKLLFILFFSFFIALGAALFAESDPWFAYSFGQDHSRLGLAIVPSFTFFAICSSLWLFSAILINTNNGDF